MIAHLSQTWTLTLFPYISPQKTHLLYTIELPDLGASIPKWTVLKHLIHKCWLHVEHEWYSSCLLHFSHSVIVHRTTYKRPYIGGNNRASRALNKLSMQVFVIKDGIFSFVSIGNKLLMNSKIEILCLISCSSRHLSTKLIIYFVFCFITYYNNGHEDLSVFRYFECLP
jgi:hypothetical protein